MTSGFGWRIDGAPPCTCDIDYAHLPTLYFLPPNPGAVDVNPQGGVNLIYVHAVYSNLVLLGLRVVELF
jgi:hypothetical protein